MRNRLEILLQIEVRGPGHVSYCHRIWHLGLLIGSLRCVVPKSSWWRTHACCRQTQGKKSLFLASEGLDSGARSKQLSGEKDIEKLSVPVTWLHVGGMGGRIAGRGLVFSAERHYLMATEVIELFG